MYGTGTDQRRQSTKAPNEAINISLNADVDDVAYVTNIQLGTQLGDDEEIARVRGFSICGKPNVGGRMS